MGTDCSLSGKSRISAFGLLLAGWQCCDINISSLAMGVGTVWFSGTTAEVILLGPMSAAKMFYWIQTGEGAEGSLRLFLPMHLRNYMNLYMAELVRANVHPWFASLSVGYPGSS